MDPAQNLTSGHHWFYEALKDFQPTIAACVALGAALIAYKAAMAKVEFERNAREVDQTLVRATLRMKLLGRSQRLAISLREYVGGKTASYIQPSQQIPMEKIPEFEEAWNNLYFLPPTAFGFLEHARAHLVVVQSLASFDPGPNDDAVRQYAEAISIEFRKLAGICEELARTLAPDESSADTTFEKDFQRASRRTLGKTLKHTFVMLSMKSKRPAN